MSKRPFAHYHDSARPTIDWVPVLISSRPMLKKLIKEVRGQYRLAVKERLAQIGELEYTKRQKANRLLRLKVARLEGENKRLREITAKLLQKKAAPDSPLWGLVEEAAPND